MEEKKKQYEEEIGKILRKAMEVSYLRKKNTEKITALLKAIRHETSEMSSPESLLDEYAHLRSRVLGNLGSTDNTSL
ncbi:hypothetical protein NECID01_0886 [Nematocida sp. AWRm77]|nr:hypothetical protein NECID01_0886 [Nematocida sp. AWRm77]